MMLLLINACVRKESRTKELADYLVSKLGQDTHEVKEVILSELELSKIDEEFLQLRDSYIAENNYSAPLFELARDFAQADLIVVAAPFWDLSFPARLKQYLEQVNVIGLTFGYNAQGMPVGLCKAKKLFYVTTAGGKIIEEEYGYGYVRALAENFYGIKECVLIKAEGLDIYGADTAAIMADAKAKINEKMM